ncbi:MAG: hypothetical protein PHW76_09190 [Alphaproteobacteria bacterium]|nr:hypothetical protein [Alphaproteobacteria bacterium]
MIEIGAVSSDRTNLTMRSAEALAFSNQTGSDGDNVQTVDMSFDDFLDMINPLQHIPGVSSIYRAVANEDINPVSRIAGDTLYGGAFGVASAGISALCALGDEAVAANNGGESATGAFMTALLGGEKDKPVQVAENKESKPQTPSPEQKLSSSSVPMTLAAGETGIAPQGMPLDRSKLPYGGVMDTAMMASAQQNQALALAMASQHNALQAQRNLHNSRLSSGTAAPVQKSPETASTEVQPEPETQAAMQRLLQDLRAMKAINQYKAAAEASPSPAGIVNTVN